MRILVTGAGGFLGRGLAAALPQAFANAEQIVLTDLSLGSPGETAAEMVPGDLADAAFLDRLVEPGFDLVFHLASIPGGLAERQQALGHRVNLLAPLSLAEKLAARRSTTRLIFASSIAVYGDVGQETVRDATVCRPQLTYGAHKQMTEILLTDMVRRGVLSAVSLRFPGIVARPLTESGHGSAFMSQLFHKISAGEPFDCPVPAVSSCWWMSRRAAVNALLHAASLTDTAATVIQPPVLHATVGEVADAVMRRTGRTAPIRFGQDMTLQRMFGSMPPLDAESALARGFRADADLDALVQATLSGD